MSIFDDVTENDFLSQLNSWLGHNPNEACSKGGHAAYGSAVYQIDNDCQEWLEIDFVTRIEVQKWLSFFGYIDISDGCLRRNVLMTVLVIFLRYFIISVWYQDVTNNDVQSPTSTYRHQDHDVTNITVTHFSRVYFFGLLNFIKAIRFRLGPYAGVLEMAQNSNCSVSLKFQLEISITCPIFEMAHLLDDFLSHLKDFRVLPIT